MNWADRVVGADLLAHHQVQLLVVHVLVSLDEVLDEGQLALLQHDIIKAVVWVACCEVFDHRRACRHAKVDKQVIS